MLPTSVRLLVQPSITFGPLVCWVICVLAMLGSLFISKSPATMYRNPISYASLIAVLAGIVASIFPVMVAFNGSMPNIHAFYIFYGLYNACAHAPAFFAFHNPFGKVASNTTAQG